MCIYYKESPKFLRQCLDSILAQTILPDEFVIVKDGPLTPELDKVLEEFGVVFSNELNIIALPENITLGPARAKGVNAAKYDYVAIMDSDDICPCDRFEKHLKMLEDNPKIGLMGGQIEEFLENPEEIIAKRTVPTNHNDIKKYAKLRNPFSHMTVMFKKQAVLEAGNYDYFPCFEDYELWARMIANGVQCANSPDVLVYARAGAGMYSRRRGKNYVKQEWKMQKRLKELKLINFFEFWRNVIVRIPVRLLPERNIEKVYGKFARK
jgi:GT2 family glycosyltransferase